MPLLRRTARRPTTWIVAGSVIVALAAAVIGAGGCQREGEPAATATSNQPSLCEALGGVAMPKLVPPPALEPPESRVTLDVRITTERLKREIASRVPPTLARESGRRIGAPGRVSYVVRRGPIGVALDGTQLVVTTPINVHAEVCKPLGPICVTYGRCDPKLQARATVPLVLSPQYEAGQSQVSVQVTEPCVIVGFDATGQIQKIANQQAAQVKGKIDRALPPIRPHVDATWKRLVRPVALESGRCLEITPERIIQAHPALTDQQLTLRVAATGRLTLLPQCPATPPDAAERPLPPLDTEPSVAEGSTLRVALTRPWVEASEQLRAAIADVRKHEQPSVHPIYRPLALHATLAGDAPRVAVEIDLLSSPCETLWLAGEAFFDPAARRIRLRGLAALHEGLAERGEVRAIAGHLERNAWLPAPRELDDARARLEQMATRIAHHKPDDAEVEMKLSDARVERVVPTPDGLAVVAVIEAELGGGAR